MCILETKIYCNNSQNQPLKWCERKVGEIRFIQASRCVCHRASFLLHIAASLYLKGLYSSFKTLRQKTSWLRSSVNQQTNGNITYSSVMQSINRLSLTVNAATLIFIYGRGLAISFAKQGKSGSIYTCKAKRGRRPRVRSTPIDNTCIVQINPV